MCIKGCDEADLACAEACNADISSEILALAHSYSMCVAECEGENPSVTMEGYCAAGPCGESYLTCVTDGSFGQGDCGMLEECLPGCSDEDCVKDCYQATTLEALLLFAATQSCTYEACLESTEDLQQCAQEVELSGVCAAQMEAFEACEAPEPAELEADYCFTAPAACSESTDPAACMSQFVQAEPEEAALYQSLSECCTPPDEVCSTLEAQYAQCGDESFACAAGTPDGSGFANCVDSYACIIGCQTNPDDLAVCQRQCYQDMESTAVFVATQTLLVCEAEGTSDCAVETVACNEAGPCVPSCAAVNACGDNGCGESCGTCTNSNEECSDGTCICVPDCDGAVCGDDGCGGVCGVCADGSSCQGVDCVLDCTPLDDCGDVVCGVLDDGCDGYLNCGDCEDNEACTGDGQCICIPDCAGKDCGDNGCGGSCGTCNAGGVCEANGQCTCTPDCSGSVNLDGLTFQQGNDIEAGYFTCLGNDEVYAFSTEDSNVFVVGNMVSHIGEQGCEVSMNYKNLSDGVTQHFTGVPTQPGGGRAYLDLETGTHSPSPTAEADIMVMCCGASEASAGSVSVVFDLFVIWSVDTAFAEIEGVPFEGVGTDAQCGDDGCGGSCGTCTQETSCNDWQVCECTPTPATICVNGSSWAVDSCGNPYDLIATCPFGCDGGVCSNCSPDCGNSECGSDGCGGSCGACTGGEVCNISPLIGNQCVCAPTNEVVCGANNGLYYADSCGNPTGDPFQSCAFGCANGACLPCQPTCGGGNGAGAYCGDDGCGGQCVCEGGEYCGPNSTCGACWVDDHCPNGDVCATMNLPTFCAECVTDGDCKGANQACIGYTCSSLEPPTLLINELDYENDGFDGQEYVEIYNYGNAISPAQLTNVYLYAINSGIGGSHSVSDTISLADLLTANLPAGGYALIGTNALLDSLNVSVPTLTMPPNTLPNAVFGGAGVALVIGALDSETHTVLDSVHYEASISSVPGFPAWSSEGNPAPTDTGAGSLSRCANGSDTDNNANNFDLTTTKTPGTTNSCSTGTNPDGPKN